MCCPLTWVWIATYTAWDFAVVCAHYPLHWFDHVAVLSGPILVPRSALVLEAWNILGTVRLRRAAAVRVS